VQLADDDRGLWDNCISNSLDAQVYHLWEWGDILCKSYNFDRYYLGVKRGADVIGILPVILIRSNIFGDKFLSLPFCEYGGPLVVNPSDHSVEKQALTLLLKSLIQLRQTLKLDYIEIRHPPTTLSLLLSSLGFRTLQRYLTFKINLARSESELWQNLKRDVRRRVAKAMKAGIEVKTGGANYLKDYYEMYLSTQKEHGSPPHSYNFFKTMYDTLESKGLMRMFLAFYQGKSIAGDIFFCFNGKMNTWSGVVDARYKDLNPTHLLFWQMIKWGSDEGLKTFDLGRTRLDAGGIYQFKSRWGGVEMNLEDYFFMDKSLTIPDPLQNRYIFLSKLWAMLPSPLVRRVGPRLVSGIGL